jgi:Sel1 repeat
MPPSDPLEPTNPAPAREETQRLPLGAPPEARDTQRLGTPDLLRVPDRRNPADSDAPEDPQATQPLGRSGGVVPPIRVHRVDEPREANGQAQVLLPPPAVRPVRWKLPAALVALVAVGTGGFLAVHRRQAPPKDPLLQPAAEAPQAVPPAVEVYLEQAKNGDAHAMRMLGVMYYYGLNVPQDREKGLQWYRQAAEKGSDAARSELEKLESGR